MAKIINDERYFARMEPTEMPRMGARGLACSDGTAFRDAKASAGSSAPADLIFGQPAKLVDAGGFRLNVRCFGTGSPTVVFDAGWGDWSPAWATVQPIVARWTRTCSYDRAGNGLSDAGPFPRTSARIARELHAALQAAGERPPFVLVGHSFGAFNMRLYADQYLPDVAGIVLVDGASEGQNR